MFESLFVANEKIVQLEKTTLAQVMALHLRTLRMQLRCESKNQNTRQHSSKLQDTKNARKS
jgi:hypothetical protein